MSKANIKKGGVEWVYSDQVKDHFFNPRNIVLEEKPRFKPDGMGKVGSPACGDVMKVWIKVDPKTRKITKCKWQTFGCASAIASTSMMSVMVTEKGGMTIEEAKKLTPQKILKRLHGLPPFKVHCSVLGDQAIKEAIKAYEKK
ncbi:MAG: iron-sulfur cluster assembly scaffold protein [Patescibacteria group bacterium]|nr:iron-sulfur cluster assembly scaffold protein [Patescibacteria group bacterium]